MNLIMVGDYSYNSFNIMYAIGFLPKNLKIISHRMERGPRSRYIPKQPSHE